MHGDLVRDPDPGDLLITCDVNGERRQEDRTSNLIFDVPALVAYLSGILTLTAGDLIFSGTPAGVGPLVTVGPSAAQFAALPCKW